MKKTFGLLAIIAFGLLTVGGCMRNDDEPTFPQRPISRLYVSFESYEVNDSEDPIMNVAVIDPADTTEMEVSYNFNSGAMGGMGIHFNPFAGRVFQAGRSDTTIRVMTVGNLGQLGITGDIGNRVLQQMRGIVYHQPSQILYVANNVTPTAIYGFFQPMNKRGFTVPVKELRLGESMRPWGMVLWGGNLLVANSSSQNGGVSLYENLADADSVETAFAPISSLRVQGATNIRGIAFVDSLDVLVMADYGTEGNSDGRIYIIEGVKAHFNETTTTVSPTRTISGANTGLLGPIDVAIDPREGKRMIYVADRTNRTVSRFPLSSSGNVAPEATITFEPFRSPFGIFLDVRGGAELDQ